MKYLLFALFITLSLNAQITNEIKVGVYQNPPKIYFDQNQRPRGFFIDLLELIAKKENWKLHYVPCEWEVCLNKLEQGEIDIMADVAYSKEREERFDFNNEVVLSTWSVAYTNKASHLKSLLDLDNKKIVVLKGSIQSHQVKDTFELFGIKPKLIEAENFNHAFELVKNKKADAAIVNRYFGALNYEAYNLNETDIFLNPAALKFAFHKSMSNTTIIGNIDKHLIELKNDKNSQYYTLLEKNLKITKKFTPPLWIKLSLIFGTLAIVLLVIAIFVFNTLLKKRTNKILEATKQLHQLEEEKIENYKQALYGMISMIEQRDAYTAGHSQRVARYSVLIAQEMHYTKEECDLLNEAAMLHDIGKIAIPDNVLLKPDKLTSLEYDIIQQHVLIGIKILEQIPMFSAMLSIIRSHHERFDGSGYPDKIYSDSIPPLARILMVADSFDAMTTNRIYKHKKTIPEALDELNSLKNIHYHPEVIEATCKALGNITINENIHQFPINPLEKERFSYFYKDPLTHLYNEKFLESLFLNTAQRYQPKSLFIILIRHFEAYNKKYSWELGNIVLKEFAEYLVRIFNEELIFRIHANDFIVFIHKPISIQNQQELIQKFLFEKELMADFIIHDCDKDTPFEYDAIAALFK